MGATTFARAGFDENLLMPSLPARSVRAENPDDRRFFISKK
jgi:hypothetical protein